MSIVTIFVQSENTSSERRFDKGISIGNLKTKLEPITGIPAESQLLQLYNGDTLVTSVEGDNYMLGAFPVDNFMTLKVFIHSSIVMKCDGLLINSVLAFKQRNKLGRFSDAHSATSDSYTFEDEAENIKVGDRCEVDFGDAEGLKRRGTVKYVGETKFKPGYWVGVQYDEPVGKHDGIVQGEQYFSCPDKYGAFVRPNKVKVGDYPEEEFEEM
ncbi:17067_t:CDS:2 [Cetraspora pellucida]|uniref:17067_t:CDS:1 n=1 Tax=Cetraspora pellucida TaxID=1433469 RepID=A0ACA9KRE4_9GLOM|nr:17067_t:CDS:2 [Cetraspora pellucida]